MEPITFVCITTSNDWANLADMLGSLPESNVVLYRNRIDPELTEVKIEAVEKTTQGKLKITSVSAIHPKLHFGDLRNAADKFVETEWAFWIDSDDRLLHSQHKQILEITELPKGVGGVSAHHIGVGRIGETKPYDAKQIRAYRKGIRWFGICHEQNCFDIEEQQLKIVDSGILVHHIGFEGTAEVLAKKALRNVQLLCEGVLSNDRLKNHYLEMLARDSNIYEIHKNGG